MAGSHVNENTLYRERNRCDSAPLKFEKKMYLGKRLLVVGSWFSNLLRTVPTIVTAHTFCASRDTRVSYGWCLLIQEYFCAV